MGNKVRNCATILYLEHHTRDEYIDMIQDLHLKAYLSPIHTDNDCKPHMHLLIFFESPKSDNQINDILESVCGVGREKVFSAVGYARYLCHLDEKNKNVYNIDDVVEFADIKHYKDFIESENEEYDKLVEVLQIVREYNIIEWCDLIDFALENDVEFLKTIKANAYLIREYIKSKHFSN